MAAAPVLDESAPPRSGAEGILQRFGRSAAALLAVIAAAAVLLYGVSRISAVVVPVLLALIPAAVLQPPTEWLKRRRDPGPLAALLVIVLALLVVGGVLVAVVPTFASQWPQVASGLEQGYRAVQDYLASGPLGLPPIRTGDLAQQARD